MISADGLTLYLHRADSGLWRAPIQPVVDFDSDGTVAMGDLLMLIESWGTDDPQCDIGPMPWGDGVVDKVDLEVLMNHWGQDIIDPIEEARKPELKAHWTLDEAEGLIAYDSVGTNDANLIGDPVWRPLGGIVDGAIELDGIGDGLVAGFVLDPKEIPFSVFAWIKGGAPGQIIISQANGTNWLLTDPFEGNLITGLQPPLGGSLNSQRRITDDQWHRVGLIWDFGTRILYVDDIEVARDSRTDLSWAQTGGGLHIGAPNRLNFPGYWSGLIDDVQVYKGVVEP